MPIVNLYDYSSYNLTIYVRWGGVIFNTLNKDEGWDGTASFGDLKPEGVYIYYLTFDDREGKQYQYRGIVTMLIDKQ